jgi:hypothetical protein
MSDFNDDAWVPLHIRGNEVAEKLYRETDTYCHNLSTENQNLRAALSAVGRERDRAADLAREYRDALARVRPERDAAERRVGELGAALREADAIVQLYCLERHRFSPQGWADADRAAMRNMKATRAALAAKEGTP